MFKCVLRCCAICCIDTPDLDILEDPLEDPYDCPYAGLKCSRIGDIPKLMTHLKNDHKVEMHDGFEFTHIFVNTHIHETENPRGVISVIGCYERHFCYHFEAFVLGMVPCYIAFLRFLGEDYEAKKFRYSLEIGGNDRQLTWQGAPSSIRDSYQKVRDSLDGLVFPQHLALFSSDENEQEHKSIVDVRIWIEK